MQTSLMINAAHKRLFLQDLTEELGPTEFYPVNGLFSVHFSGELANGFEVKSLRRYVVHRAASPSVLCYRTEKEAATYLV